jgi:hypothetical protein
MTMSLTISACFFGGPTTSCIIDQILKKFGTLKCTMFNDNASESHPTSRSLIPPYASKRVGPLSFLGPSGLVFFLAMEAKWFHLLETKFQKENLRVIIDRC